MCHYSPWTSLFLSINLWKNFCVCFSIFLQLCYYNMEEENFWRISSKIIILLHSMYESYVCKLCNVEMKFNNIFMLFVYCTNSSGRELQWFLIYSWYFMYLKELLGKALTSNYEKYSRKSRQNVAKRGREFFFVFVIHLQIFFFVRNLISYMSSQ